MVFVIVTHLFLVRVVLKTVLVDNLQKFNVSNKADNILAITVFVSSHSVELAKTTFTAHSHKFVVMGNVLMLVVTELVHPVHLVRLDSFTVLHRTVVVLQTTVV